MIIKPLANTITLNVANNVYLATVVHIANDGTARTITIANTATDDGSGQHGNYAGGQVSIRVNANQSIVVRKRPYDTVAGAATVYATKIADSGV
jgi:hypothetical protein